MMRTISTILIVVFMILMFTTIAFAKVSKIDPLLEERISAAENTSGGLVVVITHSDPNYPIDGVSDDERITNNVLATSSLCEKIKELTYAEVLWFVDNELYVGLPYTSIEKVAAIETIVSMTAYEEVSLSTKSFEEKMSDELNALIGNSDPDTEVNLMLCFNYLPAVYYGFSEDDFDDPQDFIAAKRQMNENYYTLVNSRFFEVATSNVHIKAYSISRYLPVAYITTTVSEISRLSQAEEVDDLILFSNDDLEEPGIEPSEPSEDTLGLDEPDTGDFSIGDADMDGEVTILDATCIQRYLIDLVNLYQINLFTADYDEDRTVTILDATLIQRYLAGYPNTQERDDTDD